MADKMPTIDPRRYTTDYVKSDIESAVFMGNPHVDAMMSALQSIGAEVWTNRRRQYVTEALLQKKIPITQSAIEKYMPSPEEEARWKADRDRMIEGMYGAFLRPGNVAFGSAQAQAFDPHKAPETDRFPPVKF